MRKFTSTRYWFFAPAVLALFLGPIRQPLRLVRAAGDGVGRNQENGIALPAVKRDWLLNGLQLILVEQKGTGRVRAHVRINNGAMFDLAAKGGLADLTAGMLLKGCAGLTAKGVSDFIEQSDLTADVSVGWDSTDLIFSGPSGSFEEIIDLVSRIVTTPAFDQKELDSLKAGRIKAVTIDMQDTGEAVRRKTMEAVFGRHPFGRPPRGTAESIARISRDDLVYYHNRFYIANNSEIVVCGDVTSPQFTQLARTKLGLWKKGEKVPPTFMPPDPHNKRQVLLIDRPGQRANAALGQIALSRRAGDYYSALLMNELLNALSRENTGASGRETTIESKLEARLIPGPLLVGIQGPADRAAGSIESVLDVMTRLRDGRFSAEELAAAKRRVIQDFSARIQTTEGAADAILDIEMYGLGRDYLIHFAEWIGAVTQTDVTAAAQKYLTPQSLSIVVAGPATELSAALSKLGPVTVAK
jgi:zinc protease